MVANKHVTKIIIAVTAVAVALCILASCFSDKLLAYFGGTGVTMEYESKLFNTDEIMQVDISIDEDDWNKMLQNAMSEEYYTCDVVINGKTVKNVAIRPKGNTSLSAIAMDPDTDRYSLKLEFDHFVEGQTCYGLDKLILNNNYADATNMKEAVIYDMYRFIGAEASLYNYAKVSINGEYWGVYLALEGVEESFMLRNFGTQDGELYKPDSMEMGGGDSSSSKSSLFSGGDKSGFGNMTPPSGGRPSFGGSTESETSSGEITVTAQTNAAPPSGFPGNMPDNFDPNNMPEGFDPGNMPEGFDPNNMPEGFDPSNMPEGFDPNNMPEGFGPGSIPDASKPYKAAEESTSEKAEESSAAAEKPTNEKPEETGDETKSTESSDKSTSKFSGRGGFGGKGGANLNYIDDELDSYSTIWEGEITGTSKGDHRRVVTALKNISEGTDLETYLDVDNVLKYMAVHVFAVNMDSLSGSMAHNYYLYEYDGQLNLFPWDYNLSFGGMSAGRSGGATEMVNDAIDTPFAGTNFFDALLENEEYLEKYHSYLRQLTEEYVNGGKFDEFYERVRSQIDSLVETDPTAFYDYEEYQTAADMLYKTVQLRAESIDGQLNGTIPSTDDGQRADSSAFVDASDIDIKAMGEFNMGFSGSSGDKKSDEADSGESADAEKQEGDSSDSSGKQGFSGPPDGFDFGNMPEGFEPGNMPDMGSFDPENIPENFNPGDMPEGFGPGNMPGGRNSESDTDNNEDSESKSDEKPAENKSADENSSENAGNSRPSFSGMPGDSSNQTMIKNLIIFGACIALMLAALLILKIFKRRR